MKEHREGVRRRTATNTFAFVAALAMFAMMAWRIWQLAQGVYYMAFYMKDEALEITAVAVLRQLLLVACIVYGLVVVWQSLQVWGMKREGWNGVIRIKVKQKAYWIMMIGVPLQIVSHGDMLTNAMMLITIISQMVMAALLVDGPVEKDTCEDICMVLCRGNLRDMAVWRSVLQKLRDIGK